MDMMTKPELKARKTLEALGVEVMDINELSPIKLIKVAEKAREIGRKTALEYVLGEIDKVSRKRKRQHE